MLLQAGAVVLCAENGARALEVLEREHAQLHLVLMDCQMPVLDGLEATRRWRAREGQSESRLPILALTANAAPLGDRGLRAAGRTTTTAQTLRRSDLGPYVQRWAPRGALRG
ncbi:MAG: response regulator [Planctomycetes bacterium]|nr:response regulator [Planctomycetota bacterium]